MRKILVILYIVFSGAQSVAQSCAGLFTPSKMYDRQTQLQMLSEFSLSDLKRENITPLTNKGSSYRVRTNRGYDYVIRFPNSNNDIEFEKFASLFFNEAPGLNTSEIKVVSLDSVEAESLLTDLHNVLPYAKFSENMSVSIYQPIQLGQDYLKSHGVVVSNLIEPDIYKLIENVPRSVITQLANAWVLAVILGVNDLHSKNWLIDNNQVNVIDLAFLHITPNSYSPFQKDLQFLSMSQHPIGAGAATPEITNFLIKRTSLEFRNFIQSIDDNKIALFAQQAGFRVTEKHLKYIELRKKEFLDRVFWWENLGVAQ